MSSRPPGSRPGSICVSTSSGVTTAQPLPTARHTRSSLRHNGKEGRRSSSNGYAPRRAATNSPRFTTGCWKTWPSRSTSTLSPGTHTCPDEHSRVGFAKRRECRRWRGSPIRASTTPPRAVGDHSRTCGEHSAAWQDLALPPLSARGLSQASRHLAPGLSVTFPPPHVAHGLGLRGSLASDLALEAERYLHPAPQPAGHFCTGDNRLVGPRASRRSPPSGLDDPAVERGRRVGGGGSAGLAPRDRAGVRGWSATRLPDADIGRETIVRRTRLRARCSARSRRF